MLYMQYTIFTSNYTIKIGMEYVFDLLIVDIV
jgi:hypothetical protein